MSPIKAVKVIVRNLNYLQNTNIKGGRGDFEGYKVAEAFNDVGDAIGNVAKQTASDPSGAPVNPSPIGGFQAIHLGSGMLNFSFTDNGTVQRAVDYVAELSDNPGFSNSEYVHWGPHKNNSVPVPNGNWYLKGYSHYRYGGLPSKPVVVGPIIVSGSIYSARLAGQGCGVAKPGTTGQGAGLTVSR
jgi:hypothetical protein